MGRSYEDLAKLARVCANNAYVAMSRDVAREFWRMALEYQHKAAVLRSGNLPDIGPPPAWFKE